MTYAENIARLKSASRARTSEAMSINTGAATAAGNRAITDANLLETNLNKFSVTLGKAAITRKEEQLEYGRYKRIADEEKDNLRLAELTGLINKSKAELAELKKLQSKTAGRRKSQEELQAEIDDTERLEKEHQKLKQEQLRLMGPNAYPQADRIAKLSPWAQVGYSKEKLREFNETLPDKLDWYMSNSQEPIVLGGITYTPEELKKAGINGLPFKEAAASLGVHRIAKAAGIYNYSDEMLKYGGTIDAMEKARNDRLGKDRKQYNIESSGITRAKAIKDWQHGKQDNEAFHRLLLTLANTVDSKNNVLGNNGAWSAAMEVLKREGISAGDTSVVDRIGDQPIPDDLAKELGLKKGTTWKEHWPTRFSKLRTDIEKGITANLDHALETRKQDLKRLEIKFQDAVKASGGQLTDEQVRNFEDAAIAITGQMPTFIQKYKTQSERDYNRDVKDLEELRGKQGFLTEEDLVDVHPRARNKFLDTVRKDAENMYTKDQKEERNFMIDTYLNRTWDGMGDRDKAKSVEWGVAKFNARRDFNREFNRQRKLGVPKDKAFAAAMEHVEKTFDKYKDNPTGNPYLKPRRGANVEAQETRRRILNLNNSRELLEKGGNGILNSTVLPGTSPYLDTINQMLLKGLDYRNHPDSEGAWAFYEALASDIPGVSAEDIINAQLKAQNPKHPGLWRFGRGPLTQILNNRNPVSNVSYNFKETWPTLNAVANGYLNDQGSLAYANANAMDLYSFLVNPDQPSIFDHEDNINDELYLS